MLSYGVAYKKLQSMLLESPWFLKHGKVYGRDDKNKWFLPNKGIEFRVGSQEHHALGQDVFCLVGSTVVKTEDGEDSLENLQDKLVRVWSMDDNGNAVLSDPCYVRLTRYVQDLVRIELADGAYIECTPDHKLMMSDGTYLEAQYIEPGMDIMDYKFT